MNPGELTELVSLPVEAHRAVLEAATSRILRLTVAAAREPENAPSYAVEPRAWPRVEFSAKRGKKDETVLSTGDLQITVGTAPYSLRVTDRHGRVRFETAPSARGGRYTDASLGNPPVEWTDEGMFFSRRMAPGEIAYGFGELGETFDRAGNRFTLWNTDEVHHTPLQNFYCQIPFGIHFSPAAGEESQKTEGRKQRAETKGQKAESRKQAAGRKGGKSAAAPLLCGLFVDNPGRVDVDLGRMTPGVARYRAHTGDFVLWLIFADSLPEILQEWTGLVGRMERPPLWGIGYHQCRYSYYPEKRVRKIASEFRRRRIPCDAIYLDIHYMDRFRPFTWDRKRFPDPARLTADLAQDGFRTVTIVDPGVAVSPEDEVFQSFLKKRGYFCAHEPGVPEDEGDSAGEQRRRVREGMAPLLTEALVEGHELPPMRGPETSDRIFTGIVWPGSVHFPDFTRPEVRRLWGEWQQKRLLDVGVAGIWNDMNEPSVFDTANKTFPGDVIHYDHGRQTPHSHVHQVYGMCMARASWEGLRRARPEERPFVITRSGWAGVQRYAMLWTGDNHSTWASMVLDVQLNLSMGLSGIAKVGCDIGGFVYDSTPPLYGRWIEWGVFQPFCRTHTAIDTADQEPWSFGPEVEAVAREMISLRMRLLPLFYTLFCQAAETGAPVNRPLVWHYPDDPATHRLADQFLVGSDLLIAPVLTPDTDRRLVYLPAGQWTHFFTGDRLMGGRRHVVEAPLGQPPVFVRDGAVLPMHADTRQHTGEPEPEVMVLAVWPGPDLAGELVEDDGISRRYLKGEQARYRFTGTFDGTELLLEIPKPTGRYRSPRKRWLVRIHAGGREPKQVEANGRAVTFGPGEGGTIDILLRDDRQKVNLRVVIGG